MVIKEALMMGTALLSEVSETPSLDSKILLEKACNCDRLFLLRNRDEEISADSLELYKTYLERRKLKEPVAYITNEKEFMGLPFYVDKNVLIPRPDTEILVEYAIDNCHGNILDIGTGSGAIAVSIAKYGKDVSVYACDISKKALAIAEKNASSNDAPVSFFNIDILKDDLNGKYDAVISNPPYIRSDVVLTLSENVKDYEPSLALNGGDDGLIFYRTITEKACKVLNSGGILAYEIGFDQGKEVSDIMQPLFKDIKVLKDFSGNDRVVTGIKK
ncbi:MAG: peptide chain release factor N(5)-glutamine methyltransferase [Clostridia bacterium]|nr:peptide chain release factor N(5)-glutamine methyltransferase [Clostridia bacterium]